LSDSNVSFDRDTLECSSRSLSSFKSSDGPPVSIFLVRESLESEEEELGVNWVGGEVQGLELGVISTRLEGAIGASPYSAGVELRVDMVPATCLAAGDGIVTELPGCRVPRRRIAFLCQFIQ
jgi:hypothetical protein